MAKNKNEIHGHLTLYKDEETNEYYAAISFDLGYSELAEMETCTLEITKDIPPSSFVIN